MKTRFSLIPIFFLLLFSCGKSEEPIKICGDIECSNQYSIPFELDSNGFYRANLRFNNYGSTRFNIDITSTLPQIEDVHHYTVTNGNLVIDEGMYLYVIQPKRLYHDENGFTRCIVGPVLRKHVGDTLIAYIDTYWSYPPHMELQQSELKFIIDSIQ